MKNKKDKGKIWTIILTITFIVSSALAIATAITFSNIEKVVVSGSSMENTLHNGEVGVMKKRKEGDKIERWEIVAIDAERFANHGSEDVQYIKRVVALPGETIQFKLRDDTGFHLFINNIEIEDNKARTKYFELTEYACTEPYILKEKEYFVCGDNRADSYDSRYFGKVFDDEIKCHGFWKIGDVGLSGRINYHFPKKIT